MRPLKPEEDYIDLVDKIKEYLNTDESTLINFTDITSDVIKALDAMEKYANSIPDDGYRNTLLKSIHMMRINLIQIIDTIDELNNIKED